MPNKARDIMTKDPSFCTPDTDLKSVAEMMCQHDCGEIPVVDSQDSRRPIGVVTDRDITCRTLAQGRDPFELKASDCMTSPAVTVREDAPVDECCQVLEDHQIRRVPVVDDSGRLCGIVAQADLALKAPPGRLHRVVRQVSQHVA